MINKNKLGWMILFIVIAALSIFTIVSQSQDFSGEELMTQLKGANYFWLAMSVLCMFGFIFFEALAARTTVHTLKQDKKKKHWLVYSAADIYFSAITPSATGGQPAMAFLMHRDGISAAVTTLALMLNLMMYTISLLIIGILGVLICPGILLSMSIASKIFLAIGYLILILLAISFWLISFHEKALYRIMDVVFRILDKLHMLKRKEHLYNKLEKVTSEYNACSGLIAGNSGMLIRVFFYNFLQRISQIMVSVCVFLAIGGGMSSSVKIGTVQIFSAVGSNSVPIPGGMGVADYILLDGFHAIDTVTNATNLALLCRGISFYSCICLSAVIVCMGYFFVRGEKK